MRCFTLTLCMFFSLSLYAGPVDEFMKSFRGATWKGLSPTDESATGTGEIHITFSETSTRLQMASGLAILEENMPAVSDETHELLEGERLTEFTGSAPKEDGVTTVMILPKDRDFPRFIFGKEASTPSMLFFNTNGMGEMLGPTFLIEPVENQQELLEQWIGALEKHAGVQPGSIPRIDSEGKAPAQAKSFSDRLSPEDSSS